MVRQACRRWAYASTSWERISSLAPAVLQAAEQQDQAALGIQRAVVPALVDSVEAVVKQAQLGSPFDVVLAGEPLAVAPLMLQSARKIAVHVAQHSSTAVLTPTSKRQQSDAAPLSRCVAGCCLCLVLCPACQVTAPVRLARYLPHGSQQGR